MERTQWIAAAAVAVVAGGLLLGRYGLPTTSASAAPDGEVATDAGAAAGDDDNVAIGLPDEGDIADVPEPERLGQAGDLEELDGWINTDAESFDAFDGQVRIVQFWTFSCHNCTATLPYLQDIYATYQPEGLEIIGVHAPEFEFERDPVAVEEATVDLGVTWPVALDTEKRNFRSWQPGRRFWPRTFVIDQEGEIRFNHIGEGRYDDLEATVAYLIENGP
ncbi:MAG: redoxin domain-containing protein [Actinomycetota bacterium]